MASQGEKNRSKDPPLRRARRAQQAAPLQKENDRATKAMGLVDGVQGCIKVTMARNEGKRGQIA